MSILSCSVKVKFEMARTILLTCVILIISLIVNDEAARILAVFPAPSISHQVVFRPLTQELAKRGHEVVVVTTDPVYPKGKTPKNLTEIDLHDISYGFYEDFMKISGDLHDQPKKMRIGIKMMYKLFEHQFSTEEYQKLIYNQSKTFDLVLAEACFRTALVFSHVYKAPIIQVSSLGSFQNYEFIGAPTHPLLYPTIFHQRLHDLTFWEKVTELYNHYVYETIFYDSEEEENEMLKRVFGPGTPSLDVLRNNVDMLFLNVHPIWESNRPVPPGVIYMGGLHKTESQDLPQELKNYLDSSIHGVIYISFGTNILPSLLPPEKVQMLINVFSQLPYDVLWKWDKDELPGRSKNIRIFKWLPQSDLLKHPKIKLFITQGGLQSTDEALAAGVPLIGIPLLGDQFYNVEKYVFLKIGLRLDMHSLTEDKFRNAIDTIIRDDSYRRNVVKLNTLMNDQPQSPLDRAVWWTEHVLRHGGARHLRAPAAGMSWAEYLELELISVLLLCLLTVSTAVLVHIYYLNKYLLRLFRTNKKMKAN